MKIAFLLFPHQLFLNTDLIDPNRTIYLIEEYLFFKQYPFHKQKLAYHRASMKAYQELLLSSFYQVNYISATEERADIRKLISELALQYDRIEYIDPTDNWLSKRIHQSATEAKLAYKVFPNPLFLNSPEDNQYFFKPSKKKFFQTEFYTQQRKRLNILLDEQAKPLGGKWSFDADNRKKYPRKKTPPPLEKASPNAYTMEAIQYVEQHFPNNPGTLEAGILYPIDHGAAQNWLEAFIQNRFEEFGPYEDAIVGKEYFLHHSVLTPMLNIGLLRPQDILEAVLQPSLVEKIPINSMEGFVRQIIGWREFIRGIYEVKGSYERTRNYWGFTRKIPTSFYDGTTGIVPIDTTIQKILKTAYCHHIERLMVLGNFMLLCEFDPDEVYRWFMELFIDAYDWVMVPNVYGMSQFADGGLMSTKPYFSGSNYLKKMSDYPKGDWQITWDALFWRFMHVHRDFFLKNPRLGMLVRTFDKMDASKQQYLLLHAESYLNSLD